MNDKKSPEYKARMALAKTMTRAALEGFARERGYTDADGIQHMPDSMLHRILAADSWAPNVGLTGVTVTHVGAEK